MQLYNQGTIQGEAHVYVEMSTPRFGAKHRQPLVKQTTVLHTLEVRLVSAERRCGALARGPATASRTYSRSQVPADKGRPASEHVAGAVGASQSGQRFKATRIGSPVRARFPGRPFSPGWA